MSKRKRKVKILLHDQKGVRHDVTFAMQIIYDALHSSMDFGSGMLDGEEELAMARLAHLANWEPPLFPHDRCSACSHDRQDHYGGHGCSYQTLVKKPTYERRLVTRTQPAPMTEEEGARLRMQLKVAETKDEMKALLKAAAAEVHMETVEYEATVMMDEGQREKCYCNAFKRGREQ